MHRSRAGSEYYTLPGGGVEPGETPVEACTWELKEETNLDTGIPARVCVFENLGREEHYFLVTEFEGVPELGGPERTTHGTNNSYELVWIELDCLPQVNLKPERLQRLIPSMGKTAQQKDQNANDSH